MARSLLQIDADGTAALFADLKYDGSECRSVRSTADNLRKLRRTGRHGASPYLKGFRITGVLDGNAPGHVAGFITNCFNITAGVDQGAGNTRMFFQRRRRRVNGITFSDRTQVKFDVRIIVA